MNAGSSKYWSFYKYNQLWNRMRILLYSSSTLNLTYKLRQITNSSLMYDEVINESITTGNNYNKLHNFSEGNMWRLTIDNSAGVGDCYFHIELFFSKKTIASELNLADLNEKSHASLTNIVANQHHEPFSMPIGTILMFSGTFVNNITIIGWYICDGNNGTVNLINKFVRGGATSGATGGDDDAVVVAHTHKFKTTWQKGGGTTQYAPDATGVFQAGLIENTGVSGVGKNIPAYYTLIFIQRIS